MNPDLLAQKIQIRNNHFYEDFDFIHEFVDDYFTHPRLINRYSQFKILNFYFFDYNGTFDFTKHNKVRKALVELKKSKDKELQDKYKRIIYNITYDISLFIGFRKLNKKGSLPFFLTLRKHYIEDEFSLGGFCTYDPSIWYMTDNHTFNMISDLSMNDIPNCKLKIDAYDHDSLKEIIKVGVKSRILHPKRYKNK